MCVVTAATCAELAMPNAATVAWALPTVAGSARPQTGEGSTRQFVVSWLPGQSLLLYCTVCLYDSIISDSTNIWHISWARDLCVCLVRLLRPIAYLLDQRGLTQCFGSAWFQLRIRIQIQSFDVQKLKKIYSWKKRISIFLMKHCYFLIPRPH
jgi:hypothetical protein